MGFQKIRGEWVKKSGSQAGEAGPSRPISSPPHDDIPSQIPDIHSSPSAPPPPSSMHESLPSDQPFRLPDDQVRLIASLMESAQSSLAESISQRISELEIRQTQRISELEDRLSQRLTALELGLTGELRSISERLSVIEASGYQDVSHEMGILRGRIERAADQVEASVRDLSAAQGQQLMRLLMALERRIGGFGPGGGGHGAGF